MGGFVFGGKEGWLAFGYAVLTGVLAFYNITRLRLTMKIAKLKEEETFLRDSGFNMVSIDPHKYERQLRWDKVLTWMLIVSSVYACMKLIDTLLILVPVYN